jgi:hypothetical protein
VGMLSMFLGIFSYASFRGIGMNDGEAMLGAVMVGLLPFAGAALLLSFS